MDCGGVSSSQTTEITLPILIRVRFLSAEFQRRRSQKGKPFLNPGDKTFMRRRCMGMADPLQRHTIKHANDVKRSFGALVEITQALVCDGYLDDREIHFLNEWLLENDDTCVGWPGNIIRQRVKAVLADGLITESERAYLIDTLRELIGGTAETVAAPNHVTELAFDDVSTCEFSGRPFCLTGDFVYGSWDRCEREIEQRGGIVAVSVTKALRYLVVGDRGSVEWKHGSFGIKVEKAQEYKREGVRSSS
jgi:hypothetical protein